MTREIKFRAWLKKEKRIIEPVIQLYFGHMPYIGWYETEQDALEGKLTTAFMDEVVLMEWTGSRDKNGKKIYEVDVCEGEHATYVIKWDADRAQYKAKIITTKSVLNKNCSFPLWQYYVEDDGKCRFEVIGNIYENPELLQ